MKNESGDWVVLKPLDQTDVKEAMAEYLETASEPIYFDVLTNSVFLYPQPSYSSTNGLKLYVSRTPVYFTTSDTTTEPGIPKIHHEYLPIRAAYYYCLRKQKPQKNELREDMLNFENGIREFYRDRPLYEQPKMRPVRRLSI